MPSWVGWCLTRSQLGLPLFLIRVGVRERAGGDGSHALCQGETHGTRGLKGLEDEHRDVSPMVGVHQVLQLIMNEWEYYTHTHHSLSSEGTKHTTFPPKNCAK